MPSKKKVAMATEAALPQIPTEWLDQVVTGPMTPEAVESVMRGFKKAVIERALGAEMSHHLGYRPGSTTWVGQARAIDQPPQRQQRQDGPDRRRPAAH